MRLKVVNTFMIGEIEIIDVLTWSYTTDQINIVDPLR